MSTEPTEPKHTPIMIGEAQWSFTFNHAYTYVFDEEGDQVCSINLTNPTEPVVRCVIMAYKAGFASGKKSGIFSAQWDIRRALGIKEPA